MIFHSIKTALSTILVLEFANTIFHQLLQLLFVHRAYKHKFICFFVTLLSLFQIEKTTSFLRKVSYDSRRNRAIDIFFWFPSPTIGILKIIATVFFIFILFDINIYFIIELVSFSLWIYYYCFYYFLHIYQLYFLYLYFFQ